jgi:3-hydroxyisobutyrate dehydrogenase
MHQIPKQIALIGAGIMGSGIASNLLQAGHHVRIYLRNPSKLEHLPKEQISILKGANATVFDSIPNVCEGAELVILCLTEDEVVKKAFFTEGLLTSGCAFIIDTGTTSPELTLQMHIAANEKGVKFLDAPMTGSKLAARTGNILFMIGGEKKDIDELHYFFDACGKNSIHCGPVSSGQRAKIALNMVQAGIFQVYLEGFQLATKDQIPSQVFLEILKHSAASSPLLDFKIDHVLREDFEAHFSLKNMFKDIKHAMKRATELKAMIPLSSQLTSIYQAGIEHGLGEEDFASLAKVSEKWNLNKIK